MKYLYFSGTWCQPCKQLSPIMDKVAQQITVEKIDVDEQSDLTAQYNIRNIPTVILLDSNGQEINRTVGVKDEQYYLNNFKSK